MTLYLIERLKKSECESCREAAQELERLRSIRHAQQKNLEDLNEAHKRLRERFVELGGNLRRNRNNKRSEKTKGTPRHGEAIHL